MANVAHIYALHDPRDWSIRYVGKANNCERRLRGHMRPRLPNRPLHVFISELKDLGLKPKMTILQRCSQDQWQNWEKFWIATVKTAGEQLLNLSAGGDGPMNPRAWNKGLKFSVEYRKKLSDAQKGKKRSPEHIAASARAATGRKHPPRSPEAKEKMRAAKLGKKLTFEHREKVGSYFRGRKREPGSMKWI